MAGLPGVEEGALDVPARSLLEVGVGQHDVGRLPTQLKADPLDGVGGGGTHHLTGSGGTGEGDHVHARVAGQPIAHDAAGAVHQVEHTWRHAGLVQHLGHQGAARGGVDTGLGDDRATGGQTVDDLDDASLDRPVPRRDQRADADRLATDDGAPQTRFEGILAENLPGHPHVVSWARDLSAVADGNADLARDQLGEFIGVRLVNLNDAVDQRYAFLHRRGREAFERASGSDDRAVSIGGTPQCDPGEGLLTGRVDELHVTRIDRINPSAVDIEVRVLLHERGSPQAGVRIRWVSCCGYSRRHRRSSDQ